MKSWKMGRTLWLQDDKVYETYPDNDQGAQIMVEVTDADEMETIVWVFAENQRDYETHARLIAAAPELLAALNTLLAYHDMPRDEGEYHVAVDTARAAIARAKEGS